MTRLTDEQISQAWDEATGCVPFQRAFAHRIAALAVQEVERERDEWKAMHLTQTSKRIVAEDRITTLTAQLAEVTKERDAYKRAKAENDDRFMRERDEARAQLATAKREAKRDALTKLALESEDGEYVFGTEEILRFRDREYPAPAARVTSEMVDVGVEAMAKAMNERGPIASHYAVRAILTAALSEATSG